MPTIGVTNLEHVKEIATILNQPDWLVEALIVEYLPCRRFLESDAWILFDFSDITVHDVEEIASPYIILSNITLIHNVTLEVMRTRILHGISDLPLGTLTESPYMSIPEGQASPSYIPFIHNPLGTVDWKLYLNSYAIVFEKEQDALFQWNSTLTAETLSQFEHIGGFHKPEIFSSEQQKELLRIQTEIFNTLSPNPYSTDLSLSSSLRSQLESIYKDLHTLRESMRKGVLEYHEHHKIKPEARLGYTIDTPPQITIFDQFRITNHSIQVRSHIEPLLFRTAYQAYLRAQTAKTRMETEPIPLQIAEEIEGAAESIILSAICLEAYINGVCQDHLSQSWASMERMEIREKWVEVPKRLGKPDCFKKGSAPYQNFSTLIDWRNELAHYKHEFYAPVHLGAKKQGITVSGASANYGII